MDDAFLNQKQQYEPSSQFFIGEDGFVMEKGVPTHRYAGYFIDDSKNFQRRSLVPFASFDTFKKNLGGQRTKTLDKKLEKSMFKLPKNFLLYLLSFLAFLIAYFMLRTEPHTLPAEKDVVTQTLDLSWITKEKVMGKLDFEQDSSFVQVDPKFTNKKTFLEKRTYTAFLKMREAAKADGIVLTIVSGARNFDHQKSIWEGKWHKSTILEPVERMEKILEYSSMPGTSRHHWGTDIDLNDLNNSYFAQGKGYKEYTWLLANAYKFGFYQVYTNREATNRHYGYNEEKWHWSYYPVSSKYLDFYNKNVTYNDIYGFKGAALAIRIDVIERYVNGIAKAPSKLAYPEGI